MTSHGRQRTARIVIALVLVLGMGLAGCEPRQPPKPKTVAAAVSPVAA